MNWLVILGLIWFQTKYVIEQKLQRFPFPLFPSSIIITTTKSPLLESRNRIDHWLRKNLITIQKSNNRYTCTYIHGERGTHFDWRQFHLVENPHPHLQRENTKRREREREEKKKHSVFWVICEIWLDNRVERLWWEKDEEGRDLGIFV